MASTLASSSARPLLRLSHAAAPVRQAALSASYATAPQSSGVAIGRAAAAPPVASPFATADSASETERRREERRAQYEGMTEEQRRLALQKMRKRVVADLSSMGSTQTRETAWRPHQARLSPVAARELTVSHLLAATAHVGHNVSSLSRAATQLVYGVRHGVAYIDLERVTLPALRRAASVVREVVRRDGVVLICGTAPGTQAAVLAAARRLGPNGFHVTKERWLPGVLSNAPKMLARATLGGMEEYVAELRRRRAPQSDEGARSRAPPPDPDMAQVATQELQPDVLIVLNPKANLHAIREATARGIVTIAVTDTDVDPRIATYPIPANDESVRTAELIVGVLSKAGEDGAKDRRLMLEQKAKSDSAKAVRRRLSFPGAQ